MSLWYAASRAWEALSTSPGWIDMGLSTPNVDAFGDGRDPEGLITWLEESALFQVALAQPVLALVFIDDGPEELVIPASQPRA
jgi:hypothetical protein